MSAPSKRVVPEGTMTREKSRAVQRSGPPPGHTYVRAWHSCACQAALRRVATSQGVFYVCSKCGKSASHR